jgi:hypothetical protein
MKQSEYKIINDKLLFQNTYSKEFVKEKINELGLKGLRVFSSFGESKVDNLYFLEEYTFLKELEIASFSDNDFSFNFLKYLPNLIKLSIEFDSKAKIDLSNQIYLEELSIKWRKNIVGLEKCNKIKTILVNDFFEKNLTCFKNQSLLETLKIKGSKLETLDGISSNSLLKTVIISNSKLLRSISDINKLKKIDYLEINGVTSIKDYNKLENESLNTLILIDCKNIGSIKFIENLPNLEKIIVSGNTKIEEEDVLNKNISPPSVSIVRRH